MTAQPGSTPTPSTPDRDAGGPALTASPRSAWLGRLPAFELGGVNAAHYLEIDLPDLDLARYARAWEQVIARHPALRTTITGDGRPHVLASPPRFELPVDDLRGLSATARDESLAAVRDHVLGSVRDLGQWPPFTVRAVRIDERRTRVCVSVDRVVADDESMRILGRDLAAFYLDRLTALPDVSPVEPDPAQRPGEAGLIAASWRHWRDRLADLAPAPQLPIQTDPHGMPPPVFVHRHDDLPAPAWQRLREVAAQAGLTPSSVLRAAFAESLAAWCKESRFTVVARRCARGAETRGAMGNFSRTTLLDIDADPRLPFRDRAAAVQRQTWLDLDQRHVDGADVLDELRRVTGQPTGAVLPVIHAITLGDPTPGMWTMGIGEISYEVGQEPRTWLVHRARDEAQALRLSYDSVDGLFPPGLLDDLCAHHLRLLHRLADDPGAWDEPAGPCLPPAQQAVRERVNDTAMPTAEGLLHDGFWAQSLRTPDAPATVATDRTVTYRQLRNAAVALADQLVAAGARPNHMVAVVMDKGWHQPVAAMGVLESGAAYVPIEPDVPRERLHYLLTHSEVRVALTQEHLRDTLPWPHGLQLIAVDESLLDAPERTEQRHRQGPRDLAYVIYTSGSTGLPKGVMVNHWSALNTVLDINRRFRVTAQDRMFAITPLSFDLSVYDLFGPFAVGGALVLPDAGSGRAPWHWAELLDECGVTLWNSVPALVEMLVGYLQGRRQRLPDAMRLVMMSGDWIPVSLPGRIRAVAAESIELISLGGATEASIWSIYHRITDVPEGWVSIPYGTPLANQRIEVLDAALRRRPDWVPGEQFISGRSVAMGYWHDQVKTDRSFITHPGTGERLYRTGDLGRYFPDGSIEFLGREDFQIKIHGYRIELGEIEAALLSHESVDAAVVTAIGEARGEKRLVAYVTPSGCAAPGRPDADAPPTEPAPDRELLAKAVREHLAAKLPAYMVPSHVLVLDTLPLTSNGKIDRKALPVPVARRAPAPAPVGPLERRLAAVWQEVLSRSVIDPDDGWDALGATPAQVVQAHHRITHDVDPDLPLDAMFTHRSVRALAEVLAIHGVT